MASCVGRRRRLVASLINAYAAMATMTIDGTPLPSSLVRIPLENFDQMQFFATIHVDEQPFRVIFDTGSSDVWVPSEQCQACAGIHRYHTNVTKTRALDEEGLEVVTVGVGEDEDGEPFTLQYGSGVVKGTTMRATLRLGDSLELVNARIGSVHEQGHEIQRFETEGIVGLAMGQLAHISKPTVLQMLQESSVYNLPMMFSLYLNPSPTALPPSQLIFGGVDTTLAGEDAIWYQFPVVDDPSSPAFGFWSLYLEDMAIQMTREGDVAFTSISDQSNAKTSDATISSSVAIVDSGTSLILLPVAAYKTTIKTMQQRLGTRLRNHSHRSGEYTCRNCDHTDFPALAFTFRHGKSNTNAIHSVVRFVLQGSDYVRCENRVCTPQLDESSSDMIILGDIFLRAYYSVFDYEKKQIGFACPRGICDGGVKPPLTLDTEFNQLANLGAVYMRSSLYVAIAMASLWFVTQLHARLTEFLATRTAARHATNKSLPKRYNNWLGEKPKIHRELHEPTYPPHAKIAGGTSDHISLQALAR